MPIHSRRNEYLGVNAHLHSYFQNRADWESFHTDHITDLARAINAQLPPGYIVLSERSMQIREFTLDTIRWRKPDIRIYADQPSDTLKNPLSFNAGVATRTHHVIDTLDAEEDLYFSSVMIYETLEDADARRAVTHIELLSPANKIGTNRRAYLQKRREALQAGLNLVEIDYLHQTEPIARNIPSYPQRDPEATAYTILVSQPHPTFEEGPAITYGFGVDIPIPVIEIPLAQEQAIQVDFGAPYHQTFNGLLAFSAFVDYAELPLNFDTYSPADQERIRQRMNAVATQATTAP